MRRAYVVTNNYLLPTLYAKLGSRRLTFFFLFLSLVRHLHKHLADERKKQKIKNKHANPAGI